MWQNSCENCSDSSDKKLFSPKTFFYKKKLKKKYRTFFHQKSLNMGGVCGDLCEKVTCRVSNGN